MGIIIMLVAVVFGWLKLSWSLWIKLMTRKLFACCNWHCKKRLVHRQQPQVLELLHRRMDFPRCHPPLRQMTFYIWSKRDRWVIMWTPIAITTAALAYLCKISVSFSTCRNLTSIVWCKNYKIKDWSMTRTINNPTCHCNSKMRWWWRREREMMFGLNRLERAFFPFWGLSFDHHHHHAIGCGHFMD